MARCPISSWFCGTARRSRTGSTCCLVRWRRTRRRLGTSAIHVAGGVHATAEPVQTLDAGWDVAAIGEGETTLLELVDAGGLYEGVPGLAYRDRTGALVKTGRPERLPLHTFRGLSLRWNRFNALEISRGYVFACQCKRELLPPESKSGVGRSGSRPSCQASAVAHALHSVRQFVACRRLRFVLIRR